MNMVEFSNTEGYLQLKTRWSSTGLPEFICSGLIWGCSGEIGILQMMFYRR